jgi:hypothetical protein
MAWSKLGQFKVGPQSVQELHILNVYKDSEFIKDVSLVSPYRDKFMKQPGQTTADRNKQSSKVFATTDKGKVEDLATKYAVTTSDVWWYINGYNRRGDFARKHRKPFKWVDRTDDTVTFQINIGITREDFMQVWEQFGRIIQEPNDEGKIPKNRLPKHDKLLYAIFKARQSNATFPSIYEQYKERKLAYFEGEPPTEFNSVEKFAQYYRDHKPKPIPPV